MSNIPFIDIEGGGGGSDIQLSGPPIPTPNYGILSLGGGPFDGVTTGYFKGSVNGTAIGVNLPSGSVANLLDLQTGGISRAKVDVNGAITVPLIQIASGGQIYDVPGLVPYFTFVSSPTPTITVTSRLATNIPFTVKGAPSQTANLQEWQDSTGALVASLSAPGSFPTFTMKAGGNIKTDQIFNVGNNLPYISWAEGNNSTTFMARVYNLVPVTVRGQTSQTADLQQWQSSTGSVLARVEANGNIDTGAINATSSITSTNILSLAYFSDAPAACPYISVQTAGTMTVIPRTATMVPWTVKAAASQTADLQQWQSSTGSVLAAIGATGYLGIGTAVDPSYTVKTNGTIRGVTIQGDTIQVTGSGGDFVKLISKSSATQTADVFQCQSNTGSVLARVDSSGAIAPQNGARITSGSGAPTKPGGLNPVAGDVYLRVDTPTVASQRIYVCSVGGATPTWIGIA